MTLVGGSATSPGYITTATGTDYWVATYSGDSNNSAVSSGTASEPVVISAATPTISTTQQPASATVGTSIADKATVSGGDNPTGTVTFTLYNNSGGTGTPLFTSSAVTLVGGSATSPGYTTTATGTDYWVATYSGDANNSAVSSGTAAEPVVISAATPTIATTQQPASASVGTSIADKATVSGGDNPTGTVTFTLYNNSGGTGTPLFTSSAVTLVGGVATSPGYTTTATGTDYWVATYSGDANNSAVSSGTASEPVVISAATPTIATTQQPASASVGTSIADKATVSGGDNPTGTVTFTLYNNSGGTGTPLFTSSAVTLVGGSATSPGYTTTATGTDYWVASYSGDANNSAVSSGTALEPVTITTTSPTITTSQQPATATVGSSIADTATVSGGNNPTGTVTFTLYNNSTGTGTPLFTDTETLSGGTATSSGYTATATGTDYWVATYNGDGNNASVSSGTALEPVTISAATPTISTTQQPASAIVGTSIADKATLTGGDSPTGTVTFTLYNNSGGTGTPLFTSSAVTLVGGVATSPGYTTTATGTDYWVASYSGDANNSTVSSGTASEPVVISAATPTITTTQQPASATVGTSIADKATVSGGDNPTGTVTFTLYNNSGGTGTPLFTSSAVTLVGGVATSPGYTTTATGTDYWVASYSGDANNSAVSSGTASEPVVISAATPTISTTQQPASATVGTSIADKATVSGGDNPTGTVTFTLYNNSGGTGTPLFTSSAVTLVGGSATSPGYTTTATGTDYWVASYSGDANNSAVSSGTASEPVVISAATPTISTTQQPASASVGTSIADKATVSGGDNPTGTVTFTLYNNSGGTGTPLFTSSAVTLVGGSATSPGYTTTATGTDYWVASYSGDANNSAVSSGTASEPVVISAATPTIATTQQPASATVGTSIADKATVSGGDNPTGTVTFTLYNNSGGTGTPLFTSSAVTLVGGSATSPGYTTTATGTDYWVASYSGDANNSAVSSGTAAEPVVISAATPTISTTQQPASASVGDSIADKATLSGGDNPTGTVTFTLYNNSGGTGTPLFTSSAVALVGGVATSPGYTTTATGTDYWVASYSGDANNSAVSSGTASEPVVISAATPTITTSQQPASAIVGTSIADKATVSGGDNPTGTVTFTLYNNSGGTGTPLFTSSAVTLVGGVATSPGYTTTATGTDYWVASYSGDANNSAVSSGTASEPVVISAATPTISTTQQPASATVGTSIADKATVSGGDNPTGTVTFTLYNNSGGTGMPLFTSTLVTLVGGVATSPGYTTTATGTDYWVASYSGDANNSAVSSGTASEPVVISAATPTITTSQQPASATVGTSIADKATVSGGDNPTGTVTFTLYNNSGGTGTPLFTSTLVTLVGGVATSPGYTTTATGTDYWVASYSGDSNNSAVSSGTASEPVTITPASTVATHFLITPSSYSVTAGVGFTFTVTAETASDTTATGYTGKVTFTSTDTSASFYPQSYTFIPGDGGTHTFYTTSVILFTPSTTGQTITATDSVNNLTGTSSPITVSAASGAQLTQGPIYYDVKPSEGSTGQRSMIDHVQLVFNSSTLLSSGYSFVVTTLAGDNGVPAGSQVTVSATNVGNTYTLSFSGTGVGEGGSLLDGVYSLQLRGPGNSNTQLATFFRLFGDTNGDARVDNVDLAVFQATDGSNIRQTGKYVAYLDYVGNGVINSYDEEQFGWAAGSTNRYEGYSNDEYGRYGYELDLNPADPTYGFLIPIPDFVYADGTTPPKHS